MTANQDMPSEKRAESPPRHARSNQHATAEAVADPERVAALHDVGLLDTPPELPFDRLTALARRTLGVPVVLMSLVDIDRQFFKSAQGLKEPWARRRETPLSHSFCQQVVGSGDAFVIEDAREHPLVCNNPAIAELDVVAYLGVPLLAPSGHVLGSLCAIDNRPRSWTPQEVADLTDFAAVAAIEVAARHHLKSRERDHWETNLLLEELDHRIRNLLAVVQAVARQTGVDAGNVKDFVEAFCGRLGGLASAHITLMQSRWQTAGLEEIARASLEPHFDNGHLRLDLPDTRLKPAIAVAMALILHELATNAVKYGALSSAEGEVMVGAERVTGQHLVLVWRENGGPPVASPDRAGFGTRLLETMLAQHGGAVEFDWRRSGLICRLHVPIG